MITGETYSYSRHQPPLNHISPHLASPVGEGQIPLLLDYQSVIDIQGSLHLPYGGEREGADDDHRSNDDKRSNRASPLQPPPNLSRMIGCHNQRHKQRKAVEQRHGSRHSTASFNPKRSLCRSAFYPNSVIMPFGVYPDSVIMPFWA